LQVAIEGVEPSKQD